MEQKEKREWLRKSRYDAYSTVVQEIESLGLHGKVHDNPWRFRAAAARAFLLLQDRKLAQAIRTFAEEVSKLARGDLSEIEIKSLPPEYKEMEDNIKTGFLIKALEKKGAELIERLSNDMLKD